MNTYEKLRGAIYKKKYPDGIPLEFGCEVDYSSTLGEKAIAINVTSDKLLLEDCERGCCYNQTLHEVDRFNPEGDTSMYRVNQIKILGKPITLQDILLVLHPYIKDIYMMHFSSIRMYLENRDKKTRLHIDLSLDPKDYPEETLQALLDLIKE